LASRRSHLHRQLYELVNGQLASGVSGVVSGFQIEDTRRPLSPLNGRKARWAVMVVKLYLKGVREGFIPVYPSEEMYPQPRYRVEGKGADKRARESDEGGVPR